MQLMKTLIVAMLVAAVAVGCGKNDATDDTGGGAGSASVYGFLAGDGEAGIGGAKVIMHGGTGDVEVTTQADGSFVMRDLPDGDLVFEFRAAGHAEATRRILVDSQAPPHSLWVQLKPLTASKTITLPNAGDEPVRVTGPNEKMNLIIGAGTVADEDGSANALAGGSQIDVSITPFDAETDIDRFPADVLTYGENEGDAPAPLFTYGMAYFKLTQGAKTLGVTDGKAIQWESAIPEARREFVADAEPALYYLKYADGLWLREDSARVIDADNSKVTLDMPRLTDPNVDAPPPPPTGCVKVSVKIDGHEPNRTVQISMPDSTGRSGTCFNYVCAGNQGRGRVKAHVWGNLWVERSFGGNCDNASCPNCRTVDVDLGGNDWECPDDSKFITCAGNGDCCLGMVCEDKMCVNRGN